jgi:hypothetical protein
MSCPSSACFGRIGAELSVVMKRNGPNGALSLTTATFGSLVSTDSTSEKACRPVGWYFARTSMNVNFTSAEVNGRPSCHLTPRRSRNVYIRPSALMSHDSARSGWFL